MLEQYPIQHSHAAWRVYEGQAVILCPDDSTLNTLNAVGTLIWESADGTTPLSTIVARICEEFEVDPTQAERDSAAFIEKLCERGLLTISNTPRHGP